MQTDSLASFKLLYYRYKDTVYYPLITIVFVVMVSLILVFQVVIPQFSQWFSLRDEVAKTQERIQTIQHNSSFLSSQSKQEVDEDKKTLTAALPFEKDFAGIISALTITASKTGIPLSDFSLDIGDTVNILTPSQTDTINLTILLPTTLEGGKQFLDTLRQTLPLSNVADLSFSGNSTTIVTQFYYSGFPQIVIDPTQKLTALNAKEKDLLQTLRSWELPSATGNIAGSPEASSSGFSGQFPPPL